MPTEAVECGAACLDLVRPCGVQRYKPMRCRMADGPSATFFLDVDADTKGEDKLVKN